MLALRDQYELYMGLGIVWFLLSSLLANINRDGFQSSGSGFIEDAIFGVRERTGRGFS